LFLGGSDPSFPSSVYPTKDKKKKPASPAVIAVAPAVGPASIATATPPPLVMVPTVPISTAAPVVEATLVSAQPKLTEEVNHKAEEELDEESEGSKDQVSDGAAPATNAASVEEAKVQGGDNCGTSSAVVSVMFFFYSYFSHLYTDLQLVLYTCSIIVTCFITCFLIICLCLCCNVVYRSVKNH